MDACGFTWSLYPKEGLTKSTNLHNDFVQRKIFEKCLPTLVIMYIKCYDLGKAKGLLEMHKSTDDVTIWTALIVDNA